jgi:hypothetical protein
MVEQTCLGKEETGKEDNVGHGEAVEHEDGERFSSLMNLLINTKQKKLV